MRNVKLAAELGAFLAVNHSMNPGEASEAAEVLMTCSKRLKRLDERWCNGEITEKQWDQYTDNVFRKLHKAYPGFEYYHQSDPRGCSLHIGRSSEPLTGDNYDSAGFPVCWE